MSKQTQSNAPLRRYAQPRLGFGGRAVSPEAHALLEHCLARIVLPSLPSQRQRLSSLPAIKRTLEGTVAGLVAAGGGWLRRPMSAASFTGDHGVSVNQFRKVRIALEAAGLIEVAPGYSDRSSGAGTRGAETRLRLSGQGAALVEEYGVTVGNSEQHFVDDVPELIADPS